MRRLTLPVAALIGAAVLAPAAGAGSQAGASEGTVTLSTAPRRTVADQAVELTAVVRAVQPGGMPAGAMTFFTGRTPLIGCAAIRVDPDRRQGTYRCRAVFGVQTAHLQAVFSPARGSTVAAASSPVILLRVPRAPTALSLQVAPAVVTGVATQLTAVLRLAPHDAGAIAPGGLLQLRDGGAPIPGCPAAAPTPRTLSCTVIYTHAGAHSITARYTGDDDYEPARPVQATQTAVAAQGQITARLHWRFSFTPHATRLLELAATGVPGGATLTLTCRGTGCPLHSETGTAAAPGACASAGGCPTAPAIALGGRFAHAALAPGVQLTVAITQPRRVGKSYRFTMRRAAQPTVVIACLTPGSPLAGSGCVLPPGT